MYHVIETKTGNKMSYTGPRGSTTMFATHRDALDWIMRNKLAMTHEVEFNG